ncbi:MAG: hypothetical protein H9W81_13940 [Enterococcus sp.]|nr:hypothetical protein [Enterococcus sp.]
MAETENPITKAVNDGELKPDTDKLVGSIYIDLLSSVEDPSLVSISIRSDGISQDLLTAVLDSAAKIVRQGSVPAE